MSTDWLKIVLPLDQPTAADIEGSIQNACIPLWQGAGAPPLAAMFSTKRPKRGSEYAIYVSPAMASICGAVLAQYNPAVVSAPASDEVGDFICDANADVRATLLR